MSFKERYLDLVKFGKEQKANLREVVIHHRDKIDLAFNVARTMKEFYYYDTPFAIAEGAVDCIRELVIDKNYFALEYFQESNGWIQIDFGSFPITGFFTSIISRYPSKPFRFENDSAQVKFVTFPEPLGEIGHLYVNGSEYLYFRNTENFTSQQVFDFLVEEKFKELNSNFIGFGWNGGVGGDNFDEVASYTQHSFTGERGPTLFAEELHAIDSPKADYYASYIQKYLDKGISRSLLFYGVPGTGKTSLSQTIIKNLNLRTLKFKFDNTYNFNLFLFIIKKFKIEAVILDDCDQIGADRELLELLEMLKRETKLVIAVVNSLQEFHPAILRPGRMDEIIMIDSLEPDVVKLLLGDLWDKFGDRVLKWPVAYINELVARSTVISDEELEEAWKTLDERATNQLNAMDY